jgi:hypothetical protein
MYRPDPVSTGYQDAAARALGRARAREGRWVAVTIGRLPARRFITFYRQGIDLLATDGNEPPVNRQVRGFVRALYREQLAARAGALVWSGGDQTVRGWEIRIMTAPHGDPRLPPPKARWTDPPASGTTANPALRDWH